MAADQNKTELTLRVTQAAAQWLVGVGCKAVETEVYIGDKWVADLAALWSPTRTEATKAKLIPRQPASPWGGRGNRPSDEARAAYRAKCDAREAAFDALPGIITVACEVKTSKGDFYSDDKWTREPFSDLRILAMPRGMIPKRDWPAGWWVVLHSDVGTVVTTAQRAPLTPVSDYQRMRVATNIAERRHNRTAYAMWRDLAKSHRSEENAYTNLLRIEQAIRAVANYANGRYEDLQACLAMTGGGRRFGGRSRVSKDLLRQLDELRKAVGVTAQPPDEDDQ